MMLIFGLWLYLMIFLITSNSFDLHSTLNELVKIMKPFSQPNSVPVGVYIFHILHSSPPEFDVGSFL